MKNIPVQLVGIGLDLINIGFDVAYEKSSYFEVDSKQYVLRFDLIFKGE